CDLCAAPVAEGAAPLADGQWRCAHCARDLILDDKAVQAVYAEALRAFGQVTGSTVRATPGLEVVSRTQMGAIRRRYGHEARGTRPDAAPGYHVLGYFVRRGNETTIYVERALPRGVLLGTLAHELGHA